MQQQLQLLYLLFFALLGSSLLSYLKDIFPAFTIAGGIILFLISMEMLFDKRQQRKEDDLEYNSERVSVFPLATPINSWSSWNYISNCFCLRYR